MCLVSNGVQSQSLEDYVCDAENLMAGSLRNVIRSDVMVERWQNET